MDKIHLFQYSDEVQLQQKLASTFFFKMKRVRRASKVTKKAASATSFNRFPELMESIEVLWELSGQQVWWKAEVIDISQSNASKGLTKGIIRYCAKKNYSPVDYNISFHNSTDNVKRLQHTSPMTDSLSPWKFPEEILSDEICDFAVAVELPNSSPSQSEEPDSPHAGSYRTDSCDNMHITKRSLTTTKYVLPVREILALLSFRPRNN